MKKIVILDTWVNDTNLGNKIIMEAICKQLRIMFPHDFFYHVPALEQVHAGRGLVRQADYVFLAGTNLLSSEMDKRTGWPIRMTDTLWMKNLILMGVGWWQYQTDSPTLCARVLLKRLLRKGCFHSVRDSYTASKMKALGFEVLNTGCPTMWELSREHCAAIPFSKGKSALLTFTEYSQKPDDDMLLFKILKRNYSTIYFWPQMYGDYHYAKSICDNSIKFIDPSIEALDDLLKRENVDYIGTRLHAGIRALQHKRRTIIIAVDNRCTEIGKDFNLPAISRERISQELENKILSSWATEINLDQRNIDLWKRQFCEGVMPSSITGGHPSSD